jgi:hypothetical protein
MRNSVVKNSLCLAVLVVLAGAQTEASAATVARSVMQLAPGVCGANNPANDVNLRRLPVGLKNAGTVSVSVVCSQWGDDNNSQAMGAAYIYFRTEKTTPATVTCTLSAGTPFYGQVASTKSLTLAGPTTGALVWTEADYGSSADTQWANIQCSVPAGWLMRELVFSYAENVGA